eukprot:TRINITY_DN54453_c0_g1_i1.p1 TRINITY_DN54453_c0_g1~~TRINITY_DN54453_c0_g1_i1.p1  ORF type:complete len:360 (-),score=45.71 TRINITY_DN54453_c0_g1_i1:398-1396(-)
MSSKGHNDWQCSKCHDVNFSFRTACRKCQTPKSDGNGAGSTVNSGFKSGDWNCVCGQHNFAKRTACYSCRRDRTNNEAQTPPTTVQEEQNYPNATPVAGGRAGEWRCKACKEFNRAGRDTCYGCRRTKQYVAPPPPPPPAPRTPKPGETELKAIFDGCLGSWTGSSSSDSGARRAWQSSHTLKLSLHTERPSLSRANSWKTETVDDWHKFITDTFPSQASSYGSTVAGGKTPPKTPIPLTEFKAACTQLADQIADVLKSTTQPTEAPPNPENGSEDQVLDGHPLRPVKYITATYWGDGSYDVDQYHHAIGFAGGLFLQIFFDDREYSGGALY